VTGRAAENVEARYVARWRDKSGSEHTVLGEPGEAFEALERWLVEDHGGDAGVERVAGPDPVTPAAASGAGNTACSITVPAEIPLLPDVRSMFGWIDDQQPPPAPARTSPRIQPEEPDQC
jgi:hypothetical protein